MKEKSDGESPTIAEAEFVDCANFDLQTSKPSIVNVFPFDKGTSARSTFSKYE